jgi:hypothetical protein
MPLSDKDRYDVVCKPQLEAMTIKLDRLLTCVVTGSENGQGLMQRVKTLEDIAQDESKGRRSRYVKMGPVVINGYAASDVMKFVILIAVAWLLWKGYTPDKIRQQADKFAKEQTSHGTAIFQP